MSDAQTARGEGPQKPIFKWFVNATQNIWAENRLLRFVSVLTLASSIFFMIVVARTTDQVKTIIVPFGQGAENLYLVGDEPSEGYLVSLSNNLVALGGTYTSSGVKFQFDEIMKLVHPSKYAELRDKFRTTVENLSQYREISFATYINYNSKYLFEPGIVRVPVRRHRYIGKNHSTDSGYFVISYLIEQGRFWLLDIEFERRGEVKSEQLAD